MAMAENSAAQALAYIKKRLISGEFASGARLTEEGLARDLGLSRTPVREAIRRLVADGFLRFKPNSGTYVAEWNDDEIRQIFDLRTLLESQIAEAAAATISTEELRALEAVQREMDEAAADRSAAGLQRRSALNRRFHALIAQASGKTRLASALASAIEMPIVQQTFRRYSAAQARRSLAHHHELLDALRARDPQWARAVMTSHIRAAMNALLKPG
jgi:DNA-binding GntR family transcriptional regulator